MINTRCTAKGRHSGIFFRIAEKGCCVKNIFDFIITIDKVFRKLVTVFQTSFYMKTQGFCKFGLKLIKCFGSHHNSSRLVITPYTTEIIVSPSNIYFNKISFHILSLFV